MAQEHHTQQLVRAEEKNMVLFCLVKDVYQSINPWTRRYESLKLLSDSEALALVLFQQRRSVEPERSFLRDGAYFFSYLFPGVGLALVVVDDALKLIFTSDPPARRLPARSVTFWSGSVAV